MQTSIAAIAAATSARVAGDSQLQVTGIASVASARQGDLVFAEDPENFDKALRSAATAIIAGEFALGDLESFAGPGDQRQATRPDAGQDVRQGAKKSRQKGQRKLKTSQAVLIVPQPRLAFVRAFNLLQASPPGASEPPAEVGNQIHPTAIIHPRAKLGKQVAVGPYAVLEKDVVVGDRTFIGPGCFLAAGVTVGVDCRLVAQVVVYSGTRLGDQVIVHAGAVLGGDGFGFVRDESNGRYQKFPQVGRLRIGDRVEIGANSTIDRGALDSTLIGSGTKLDNLVHVGHNTVIGENVVIAAQTGISGSSVIENNVIIGGQVGIADHVLIEEGAVLGGQSGILTKKKLAGKGIIYWGTPARPLPQVLKELAALARLVKPR